MRGDELRLTCCCPFRRCSGPERSTEVWEYDAAAAHITWRGLATLIRAVTPPEFTIEEAGYRIISRSSRPRASNSWYARTEVSRTRWASTYRSSRVPAACPLEHSRCAGRGSRSDRGAEEDVRLSGHDCGGAARYGLRHSHPRGARHLDAGAAGYGRTRPASRRRAESALAPRPNIHDPPRHARTLRRIEPARHTIDPALRGRERFAAVGPTWVQTITVPVDEPPMPTVTSPLPVILATAMISSRDLATRAIHDQLRAHQTTATSAGTCHGSVVRSIRRGRARAAHRSPQRHLLRPHAGARPRL